MAFSGTGGFGTSSTGFGNFSTNLTPQAQGFGFGQQQQAPASSVSTFGFGQPATSTQQSFGFGQTTQAQPGSFGAAPFNFSQPAVTSSAFGGFGGFGTQPQQNTAPNAFSFNNPATTSGGGMFSGGFGGTQSTGFGFGGAGFGTSKPSFGFGTTTNAPTLGGTGFGGFGTSFGGLQQQQQQQVNPTQALYNALFCCSKFGDERDTLLARWNLLQASWGTGKGYYAQNMPPVDFTPDNPFCRFKAVGFSTLPTSRNEEGLVVITISKKEADVRSKEAQLIGGLNTALGNKPSIAIRLENVKALSEDKCQVTIYVEEKGVTGSVHRVLATDLCNALMQPMVRPQLGNLGVEGVIAKVAPTPEQIKDYLDNPPAGLDFRLWKQAQLDNPDVTKLIPVPVVGFTELQRRIQCQEQETRLHQGRMDMIAEDIYEMQRKHTATGARIAEAKRKQLELAHKILKVMVRVEIARKSGMSLQPEEEALRIQLEGLQSELNAPTQFKGRLNEVLSQIRMQSQQIAGKASERYIIDQAAQDDIKQFLKTQQEGITHLISVIKDDADDLKTLEEGVKKR